MNDLVSVIIPVYKTEKYLDECVESIVKQTYKNLEIILVDDGSPDNSPAMCDAWAEKDSRIKVIHKPNGGAADSRNKGLEIATGKWILFMDSDDWYKTYDVIFRLVENAERENADIVCFNYQRYFEDKEIYSPLLCSFNGTVINKNSLVTNNIYTSSACLKLIKTDLIKTNSIFFDKNIIAEDIPFCAQLLQSAESISFCETAVYVYRDRQGSKTNSIRSSYARDAYAIISNLAASDNADTEYMTYTAFQYCTLLINMNFDKIDKDLEKKIFSLKWLLKYDAIPQVKLIHTVSRLLGIKLTSKLLFIYFKLIIK